MKTVLVDAMVFLGSALMAYNIYRYILFSRHIRASGNWDSESRIFNIPILLLILFLIGYLCVGFFGHPDPVMGAILFGGSIFVLVMLLLIQRTTDRIQENERLEAELKAAEEASKAKTAFLSNMSHDIRTPLNAIIGYTTLAGRESATGEEKTDYIRKIENAGQQLLDIVNDVLEMSRIESGKMELAPAPMNLEESVREAGDLVRTQLSAKQIRFTVSFEIRDRWVLCDRSRLNRALMNLLCNAGKFTGENGEVWLSLKELGEAQDGTGTYEIRVRDTGIGMSPEFVEHIFKPFERERTSTISRIQGTGLGMAITKNIIDLMNGTIEVETEKGKGSEFIITLRLPLTEPGEEKNDPDGKKYSFQNTRLLLAEDNPVNMEIARMILEEAGFQVDEAENGQKAVDLLAASAPGYYSAVLMDIQMPEMDGYAATRAIRQLEDPELAAVPVVAMTANAFREDIRAAAEAGMNGHIAKPLNVTEMMDVLKTVLGGQKTEQEE